METNTVAYWTALGVLALGLNSEYHHGNFVALHRVAESAGAVVCRISTHAEQTLAGMSALKSRNDFHDNLLAANDQAEMVRDEAELARDQARVEAELIRDRVRDQVRAQADAIREQADMQRAQIQKIRWDVVSQIRISRNRDKRGVVVCPKTGTGISVNTDGDLPGLSPDVEDGGIF